MAECPTCYGRRYVDQDGKPYDQFSIAVYPCRECCGGVVSCCDTAGEGSSADGPTGIVSGAASRTITSRGRV